MEFEKEDLVEILKEFFEAGIDYCTDTSNPNFESYYKIWQNSKNIKKTLPKVVELKKTCDVCPTQWQGKLEDGRMLYMRYRWGNFNAYLSKNSTDSVQEAITGDVLISIDNYGDHFDGEMEDSVMMKIMSSKLNFCRMK